MKAWAANTQLLFGEITGGTWEEGESLPAWRAYVYRELLSLGWLGEELKQAYYEATAPARPRREADPHYVAELDSADAEEGANLTKL